MTHVKTSKNRWFAKNFPTVVKIVKTVKKVGKGLHIWTSRKPLEDRSYQKAVIDTLEVINKLLTHDNPYEQLDNILELTQKLCHATKVRLWVEKEDGFECVASVPYIEPEKWKLLKEERIPKDKEFIKKILASKRPVVLNERELEEIRDEDPTIEILQPKRLMVRKLNLRSSVKGLLVVEFINGHDKGYIVGVFNEMCDILEKLFAQADLMKTLSQLAITDGLTKLYNSRFYVDQLKKEVERARTEKNGRKLALMLIDGDNFKSINDRFGYKVGDRVLKLMGMRLKEAVNGYDAYACRRGGDEFAVIAWVDEDEYVPFAKRIHESMCFTIDTRSLGVYEKNTEEVIPPKLHITVTAGVDVWKDAYEDAETFERLVNMVLLESKTNNEKGTLRFGLYKGNKRKTGAEAR